MGCDPTNISAEEVFTNVVQIIILYMQVGGWAQSFSRLKEGKNETYLTYATVRGAAHEVPFTSPSQALTLFQSFLAGSPLPTK